VKCSTKPKAIEYLASIGMADTVSKYIAELEAENARLKAEVERLNNTSTNADRFLISGLEQDVAILKEQVARLTKAGDEMAFHYHQLELRVGNYSFSVKAPSIQAWEKAKEVQS